MGYRIGVQLPVRGIYLSLTNHPGQLSLTIPPWIGAMSTGQRAVMLCDWEYSHIWCCLQVTLCDPYLRCLRKRALQIHVYFTYFTLLQIQPSRKLPQILTSMPPECSGIIIIIINAIIKVSLK